MFARFIPVTIFAIAAGISVLVHSAYLSRAQAPPPAAHALKYTWGELTKGEQAEAAGLIGNLDRREVEIFCGIPACGDLAEDIDEIMDMAGAASTVRRPVMDLGGGIGIMPADDQARKIAAAIKSATGGRVDLQVIELPVSGGGIAIVLGRAPRK